MKKKDCCLQDHQCDFTVKIKGDNGIYHCLRKRGHKGHHHITETF